MLTACYLIIVHVLAAMLASASSATTSLNTPNKHFPVADVFARIQSKAASRHFDSPQVRLRVSTCEHESRLKKLFTASLDIKSEYLLAADILARAQGEAASHHFESPQVRLRVDTEEREEMLSKIIGARITVQPLRETATYHKHVRQVTIRRAFVFNLPFEAIPYLDQDENARHILSVWPFFFSVAPSHYDAYARSKIPVGAVDLVKMGDISLGFKMSPGMLAAARKLREKALKARFFPSPHRPLSASTGETVTYRLMLPLDNLFHPETFSHPFLDLGDILKIIVIYCARQKVDFHAFYPLLMPSVYIAPIYANPIEESRFAARYYNGKSVSEDVASASFIQVLTGPTFRLIRPRTPSVYMQWIDVVKSATPWPSLDLFPTSIPQILLSRNCELVTNPEEQRLIGHAARFLSLSLERDKHKLEFAKRMELAKEVWLDIEIPANTPEKLQLIAAIAELRRLSAHIDFEKRYLMALETRFSTTDDA